MENVLDSSFPDHRRTGIHNPVAAQKATLTRCCSITQQLNSVTGKLRSCKEDNHWTQSPERERATAPAAGTGVYFQHLSSSSSGLESDFDDSGFQNLFKLATIACEVESSIRHRQLVKRRRTPRKVLWINGIITNGSCKKRIPSAPISVVAKRQRAGEPSVGLYTQPPWLQPVEDTCTNILNSSNTGILKFGLQVGTTRKKIMACSPKNSGIEINKVSKRSPRVSSVRSKSRVRRSPGKDTRVQGVAKRILQFVGDGSSAEKFIRVAFGNNPDTSKALRLLLAQHKVYRIGDGGRGNAFIYVATPVGLKELQDMKNANVITTVTDDNPAKTHQLQDGPQMSQKDSVSPLTNLHGGPLPSRCAFRDVSNCLPETKTSEKILHAILGKNEE